VAFGDGMPASAKWVREGILAKYEGRKLAAETAVTGEAVKRANQKLIGNQ